MKLLIFFNKGHNSSKTRAKTIYKVASQYQFDLNFSFIEKDMFRFSEKATKI